MAKARGVLVSVPEDKGVHVKPAGAKGERYVYRYTSYFRNDDGKPRNKARMIGKMDEATGKMAPNANYFEMYALDCALPDVSVWDYGYPYAVLEVCRDIGLMECLSASLGDGIALDVVACASYIIREGNAMDGIDDWLTRGPLPGHGRILTSQSVSRLFASLGPGKREHFFTLWVEKALSGGSVCYDVTSISSYAQEMPSVERGYNRDHDNMAQYNLGMFCDEMTRAPLYYDRYNGSLTDKANLTCVLANARAVGIDRVKMFLDGGFWSTECIRALAVSCEAFTVGMPMHLDAARATLKERGSNIESYRNKLKGSNIYCVGTDTGIYGVKGRVLLFYDPQGRASQSAALSERIERLSSELAGLKHYPKGKLSRYTPFFTLVRREGGSGFDYAVDDEKADALMREKGFFLLFTTDMASTPADILYYYRAKDADEKIFSQIKVDMEGCRIRTHSEATTDGKAFVTFVACVIRSHFLRALSDYLAASSSSLKKSFAQLSDIRLISSGDGWRFAKTLTKKQKQVLSALGLAEDIVKSVKDGCLR